jgi:hypothetical protein
MNGTEFTYQGFNYEFENTIASKSGQEKASEIYQETPGKNCI